MFIRCLIAAGMVGGGASAAELPNPPFDQALRAVMTTQDPIERCIDDLAASGLQAIRQKADLSRLAADGPLPYRVALNDTFATDSERVDIARWLRIQDYCRRHFAMARTSMVSRSAKQAASLGELYILSNVFQSGVRELVVALYCRELTYGEFVLKKYEFTREAAALSSAIGEAGEGTDENRLGQTLQQLRNLRFTWSTYVRRISARPPATVHIPGLIST